MKVSQNLLRVVWGMVVVGAPGILPCLVSESRYHFLSLSLQNVLLEESDSDSDNEQVITERDLKILLKIHKYRRKYQKRYHTDILVSTCYSFDPFADLSNPFTVF